MISKDEETVRILSPLRTSPVTQNACDHLDEYHKKIFGEVDNQKLPSTKIKGALYSLRYECQANPDRISQAAHSIREVIYPFIKVINPIQINLDIPKEQLTSDVLDRSDFQKLNWLYSWFCDLAHHCSDPKILTNPDDFVKVTAIDVKSNLNQFISIFRDIVMPFQLAIHTSIDKLVRKKKGKKIQETLQYLINQNEDAKQYFYTQAPPDWIKWLQKNGFFECLSEKVQSTDESSYIMPELGYLARVAKDLPYKVEQVISDTKITPETYNSEVVYHYLRIMSELPAPALAKLIPKLAKEEWLKLGRGKRWGFGYEKMFATLSQVKESKSIIQLTKIVLEVKTASDLRGGDAIYFPEDDTFYFENLTQTGVFGALCSLPVEHQELALDTISEILSSVVELWDSMSKSKKKKDNPFDTSDRFMLANYIPSEIKLHDENDGHRQDNLYDLVASFLCLFDNLVEHDQSEKNIHDLYTRYFGSLPNSQAMWRIKLYIIKRYPDYFAKEYAEAKKKGYTKIESTLLEPLIGPIRSGDVIKRSPISQEEFNKLSIDIIIDNLKNDWSPDKLAEQNTGSDGVFHPFAPDAIGDLVRDDFSNRPQNYLDHAESFFVPDNIHLHYTHRYLSSIIEYIKNSREDASELQWDNLMSLLSSIFDFDQVDSPQRSGSWLAGWDWVFSSITELLSELMTQESKISAINFKTYRKELLNNITLLLKYSSPVPADEDIKTARSITTSSESQKKEITDPYTMAINSVRGKAFRTFLTYIFHDGKTLKKETKTLYLDTLKSEGTRAIMFLFGYNLAPIFFRDQEWTRKQLKSIFQKHEDQNLSLAVWEGYLANNLYQELFFDTQIQKLYSLAIGATRHYPDQKHFQDPAKGLASHFALAFMYYPEFNLEHPLFRKLWENGTTIQQVEFVNFLGRSLTSKQDRRYVKFLEENPDNVDDLKEFWSNLLSSDSDSQVLEAFGYWINSDNNIFDDVWLSKQINATLTQTKGKTIWDYGLTQIICRLAQASPKDALEIVKLFFDNLIHDTSRYPTERYVEKEWKDALEIIWKDDLHHKETRSLVDYLVEAGGRSFWTLKDIIVESNKFS